MLNKLRNYYSRLSIFLMNWRSFTISRILQYIFMFASIPMLFYGLQNYNFEVFYMIILTIITLYSGFFATLFWNDITDIEIDKIVHPDRPLPMGRISKKNMFTIALFFSLSTFIFSFLISICNLRLSSKFPTLNK